MQVAVDTLWRFTGEFTTADDVETQLAEAGIAPCPQQLAHDWQGLVKEVLTDATLTLMSEDA